MDARAPETLESPTVKKTLLAAAAVTSAALVLTACGGDGDSGGGKDDIKGADSPSASASATGDADTRPGHPKITLPSDLDVTFEGFTTGDKAKDAVLADSAARVRAMDAAKVEGKTMTDAVRFYTDPTALVAAQKSLKFYADKGYSVTGKFRYYDQKVTLSGSGFGAELTYCGDESKGFASVRKTGKVLTTPVDKDSYVRYSALLRKNDKGVWQTASMSTDRGAAACQP